MQRCLLLFALLISYSCSFAQTNNTIEGVYLDEERATGFIVSLYPSEENPGIEVHHDIFDETGVTIYRETSIAVALEEKGYYQAPFDSQSIILHFTTDKKGTKLLKTYHQGDLIGTYALTPDFQVILSDIDIMYQDEEIIYEDEEITDESFEEVEFTVYQTTEGSELYFNSNEEYTIINLFGLETDECYTNRSELIFETSDKSTYTHIVTGCAQLTFKVEEERITVEERVCGDSEETCPSKSGVYLKQP